MPTATPTSSEPSHHLTLSDGSTTVGLILVDKNNNADPTAITREPMKRTPDQVAEGDLQYSDFSGPHRPIAQSDWSKGRGQEDFIDPKRFYDSYRVNTWIPGQITLGGQETYSTGLRNQNMVMPGSVTWTSLRGATRYMARSFVAGADYTADGAFLWVRRVGTPTGNLVVELNANTGGNPGAAAKTVTVTPTTFGTDQVSKLYFFDWTTTESLSNATTYWIKIYSSAADASGAEWQVGTSATAGTTKSSSDNSSWSAASVGLYYRVVDGDYYRAHLFYEYKGALYLVTYQYVPGTAPRVFINGDRGAADANTGALTTLVDGTKSWTTDEWAGCVVKITAGPGFNDEPNYRTISSNTATALTVSPAFSTEHTTSTEYVIVGSNKWTEMTGHGMTGDRVRQVLVSNGVVYFPMGESVNIRRHREYNNSGTWTNSDWADDGTNKASYLQLAQDPVNGYQVWRANSPEQGTVQTVSRSAVKAWGTNLSFGTAITVGDSNDRIRGLEVYGAPQTLWVLKEGSVWTIVDDVAVPIPLREMQAAQSSDTGVAHCVNDVYLYFSLLNSVQEYYRAEINNIGPSIDAGLPSGRQGRVTNLLSFPGQIIASEFDQDGTSSVLRFRNRGWHEEYRAPIAGKHILLSYIQVIPGSASDRLWISEGSDVLWVPIPSLTSEPTRDSSFRFTHEGAIVSSWHYANLQDVRKSFNTLKLFAENLTASAQIVEAEYQTDDSSDSSAWTSINGTFDSSPVEEVEISSATPPNVTGRRIRYRLRLQTNDNTQTPKVKAAVLEVISRPAVKFAYSFRFRARDENLDLEGDDDTYTAVETLTAQLETWANNATVLTMRSIFSPHDNKEVMLDAEKLQPQIVIPDDQIEAHVGECVVFEV